MYDPKVIPYIRKNIRQLSEEEKQKIFPNRNASSINKSESEEEKNSLRFLLFLVGLTYPSDQREDMLGHITERYNKNKETVGSKYAKLWIIRDVGASIVPIVYGVLRSKTIRLLRKIGLEIVIKYFLG
jgi:hypothetical protein